MTNANNLFEIIERIYDNVLSDNGWAEVLDQIAHSVDAYGLIMFDLHSDERANDRLTSSFMTSNYNPKNVHQYIQHFGSYELEDQIEFAKRSDRNEKIELVGVNEFYSPEILNTRPNAVFMKEQGILHRQGAILNKDSWRIDRFSVQFSKPAEQIDPQNLVMLKQLLPHLSKAFRLSRPIQPEYQKSNAPTALVNPQIGICILTAQSEVIFQNAEFEAISELHNLFIGSTKRALHPRNATLNEYLTEALSGQAITGRFGAKPRRESLSLHVPESSGTLFVEISPTSIHPELGKFPDGSHVVMMLDIERLREDYSIGLSKFFPLSEAELEICQLIIDGYSNTEIAEIRGRSRETVNSQVKSVLRKTYTSGRTELSHLSYSLSRSFGTF